MRACLRPYLVLGRGCGRASFAVSDGTVAFTASAAKPFALHKLIIQRYREKRGRQLECTTAILTEMVLLDHGNGTRRDHGASCFLHHLWHSLATFLHVEPFPPFDLGDD